MAWMEWMAWMAVGFMGPADVAAAGVAASASAAAGAGATPPPPAAAAAAPLPRKRSRRTQKCAKCQQPSGTLLFGPGGYDTYCIRCWERAQGCPQSAHSD